MADNVLIATANDANGAHQKIVNEFLDAAGLPVAVTAANPLPVAAVISTAGLATSAGQTSGNSSLSSIDGKTPALGQALLAASSPVVLPAAQIAALTPQTNALTDTQLRATPIPVSFIGGADATAANQTTEISKLTSIDGKIPVLGQALATASTPVVLTAIQQAALTPPAAITGFALAAKQDLLLTELQLKAKLTETQPVSIAGTVAVSGGLTDVQLRATPIPVSMVSDIQIGAVELKNATTDDRVAIINTVPTIEFGVVTRNIPSGTQPVSVSTLPLPTGAATAANQQTNAITDAQIRATPLPISGTVNTGLTQPLTDTQLRAAALPISAVALPLPTGASTSALQGTGNTSLSSIDTKTPALGQALAAGSTPIVLTAIQQAALTPPAAIIGFNLEATQLLVKAKTDNIPAQGQALAAASLPVVLPAAQITALTPPAQITGYALAANQQTNAITDAQIRATPLSISGSVSTGLAQPLTDTQIRATALPISAATLPLPTGASTEATLGALNTKIPSGLVVTTGRLQVELPVGVSGLTNTEIRATPLPVSGTVAANATLSAETTKVIGTVNVAGTLPVSGAFFQATQPVSATSLPLPTGAATSANQQTNAITDTQIRATPLPVSGTVVTGGLTDTQIRATPLTVTMVNTLALTDTQLRATPVPISIASDADNTASGALSAALQTVVLNVAGKSSAVFKVTNTWAGTITFEGSVDGTLWDSINAVASSTSQPQPTTTVNGSYRLTPAAFFQIRAIMTLWTSGTATISARSSSATGGVFANQILPSKITDGTNTAAIKPASTAAAATDTPLVVALHPSSTTPNFTAAQPVTGTFFQATQPVSGVFFQATQPISGTVAASATLSAETTKVIGTVNVAGTVPVSGTFFQATQPVSLATNTPDVTDRAGRLLGAIANTAFTANAGTNLNTSALALDATLIGGTAKSISRGGAKGTAVAADVTSNPVDANTQALHVTLAGTQATVPVTGAFFQTTQPVSIATNVPVTGTFFQTTQPISGTVSANATLSPETTKVIGTVNVAGTVPVSGTFFQATQPVSIASMPTTPVTGTFFQATQPISATALPLPTGAAQDGTDITTPTAMPAGGLGIRGWLSSIWTKLNGSLAVTGAFFQATQPISGTVAANATLSAETTKIIGTVNLSAAQTIAAVTAITNQLPVGANKIGTVDIATAPATVKGTQGANFLPTQDAKDAGRNQVHYYTVIPVLTSATDTLQSLTGTKAGATVVATATPAVVTTGKTFRVTRMAATYIATAVSGYGVVRLRFNTAGVVAITSPIAATLALGSGAPTTANATDTEEATLDEGWEFASGTGVGVSVQGFAGVTGTAVGYVLVSYTGYEY